MFDRKLREAEASGAIKEMQERMVADARRSVERPVPVTGIVPATVFAAYDYDPTVTAAQDYYDNDGNVVVKAGTQANPFDLISMSHDLIFIDGDRQVELDWALQEYSRRKGAVKIILFKGAPLEIMREKKVRVYFDQKGALSRQLELARSPTRVSQKGRYLLIEEIPLIDEIGG